MMRVVKNDKKLLCHSEPEAPASPELQRGEKNPMESTGSFAEFTLSAVEGLRMTPTKIEFSRNISKLFFSIVVTMAFLLPLTVRANELEEGKQLLSDGDLKGAAEFFNRYAATNPNDSKNTPEALALCGRTLDAIADVLTGAAEKECYWTKSGSPECMERQVGLFNAKYGDGAFRYEHAITYIYYTGSHYRQILSRFPKSAYADEAEFFLLLHDLAGHPDSVLPKIKAFLSKHPKGEWNRKGLLMWARVNEDIWHVHRKWSWVLYNGKLGADELLVRAEKYRQEALGTYEKLMREKNTFEGKAAVREYALLRNNQDDDATYSIVNDSIPGTLSKWGIEIPQSGSAPSPKETRSEKKTKKEKSAPEEDKSESTAPKVPSRWK